MMTIIECFYKYTGFIISRSFSLCENSSGDTSIISKPTDDDFLSAAENFLNLNRSVQSQFGEHVGPCLNTDDVEEKEFAAKQVSNKKLTPIIHCRQLDDWDCGLACVLMFLRWVGHLSDSNVKSNSGKISHFNAFNDCEGYGISLNLSKEEIENRKNMLKILATTSIWSIDLVFLLQQIMMTSSKSNVHPFSIFFCTKNLGVDETYGNFSFYKTAFERDKRRVHDRFQFTRNMDIPMFLISSGVNKSSLQIRHLIDLIQRCNCIAIALVDNNILLQRNETQHQSCNLDENSGIDKNKIRGVQRVEYPGENGMLYSGHYILLTGISSAKQDIDQAIMNERNSLEAGDEHKASSSKDSTSYCIVIKNPGSTKSVDFLTPAHFECAWRAEGTDQDIIFLRKHT